MKPLELRVPPPVVMLVLGLMMWLSSEWLPALSFPWLQSTPVAIVTAVFGLLIGLAGVVTFWRASTTMDPKHPEEASTLLSSGIYRYSRNPMYLGVLLLLAGWAIHLGNLLSLLCALIFIAYITRFQIIPEERLLQEKFGAEFQAYKDSVRRWI